MKIILNFFRCEFRRGGFKKVVNNYKIFSSTAFHENIHNIAVIKVPPKLHCITGGEFMRFVLAISEYLSC